MVYERYVYWSEDLATWKDECLEESKKLPSQITAEEAVEVLNRRLKTFKLSHLYVYVPTEGARTLSGIDSENGFVLKSLSDELVVWKVIAGSPADRAGVKFGDILLRHNGSDSFSTYEAPISRGAFTFRRGGNEFTVDLVPEMIKIDTSPQIYDLGNRVALLSITSFRREYFEMDAWLNVVEKLGAFKKVVIDLRGNAGGNFVAVLRALSTFMCDEIKIGEIAQPRLDRPEEQDLLDSLEADQQVYQFDRHGILNLKTWSDYGCFAGPVAVIVDDGTSSVSEIFAQTMKGRADAKIIGKKTAGEVVLASFYQLRMFGPGFSISIPEAIFKTPDGKILERVGVEPDVRLELKLEDAIRGQDTMVLEARRQLSNL